jgi:hypothetical protein
MTEFRLSYERLKALRLFPPYGQMQDFRSTVFMKWKTFDYLRKAGWVTGDTNRSCLTEDGQAVLRGEL